MKQREPIPRVPGADVPNMKVEAANPLQELYERYHRQVYRLALRYGRGRISWAEDVTHDVFLKLLRSNTRLDDPEHLDGWFYRVTANLCLNRLRHEALRESAPIRWLLGQDRVETATPEARVLLSAELQAAGDALSHLPPKERICFCMRYLDEKSQDEIASILGHSKGHVSRLIARARTRLAARGWEIVDG